MNSKIRRLIAASVLSVGFAAYLPGAFGASISPIVRAAGIPGSGPLVSAGIPGSGPLFSAGIPGSGPLVAAGIPGSGPLFASHGYSTAAGIPGSGPLAA
ncbi:MAG TPA: hypothetical protein VNL71_13020 [Chloroflexota bacterium]|nr:hypothetical protein [Chloroflexota bacterium]